MKERTMKRISHALIAGLVGCLMAMTATASAAPSKRTAEKSYSMSNGMITGSSSAYWTIGSDLKKFKTRAGERTVVVSVADEIGTEVRGQIYTDVDGDGDLEQAADFCNESNALRVRPAQRVYVAVLFGECPDGETSVVTEGTITATFSK